MLLLNVDVAGPAIYLSGRVDDSGLHVRVRAVQDRLVAAGISGHLALQ